MEVVVEVEVVGEVHQKMNDWGSETRSFMIGGEIESDLCATRLFISLLIVNSSVITWNSNKNREFDKKLFT